MIIQLERYQSKNKQKKQTLMTLTKADKILLIVVMSQTPTFLFKLPQKFQKRRMGTEPSHMSLLL